PVQWRQREVGSRAPYLGPIGHRLLHVADAGGEGGSQHQDGGQGHPPAPPCRRGGRAGRIRAPPALGSRLASHRRGLPPPPSRVPAGRQRGRRPLAPGARTRRPPAAGPPLPRSPPPPPA